MDTLLLFVVVTTAFFVQTTLGFGAGLTTVALGALVMPLGTLLPAYIVPATLATSIVVWRNSSHIRWGLLLKRIVPLMAIGFPIGMWMFRAAPEALMKGLFGVGVAVLAAVELAQLVRAEQPPQPEHVSRPPTRRGLARTVALIGAGIAQGAWMTGGPLVVYAAGHELDDKHAFRATLCALWLSSQLLLATSYLLAGDMTLETLSLSGLLVVAVPLGLALGEWAYGTLSQKTFRTLVFVGLFVAGVLLSRSLVGYLDIFSVL